jgi:uncharacterized protein YndB with AHSA1/START domain
MTAQSIAAAPAVTVSRTIPAPREQVFAAWLDADGMRHWMRPDDIRETEAELDARVGGRFRIVMRGAETDYVMTGEYVEIDPPSRILLTWASNVTTGESRITLEFHDRGDETELVLTHERISDAATAANYEKGWSEIVDSLAARMAG